MVAVYVAVRGVIVMMTVEMIVMKNDGVRECLHYLTVHAKIKHESVKLFLELAMDNTKTMPGEPP